jgi:hypothetical protein
MTQKYSQQLLEASKKFHGTKYEVEIEKASSAYLAENYKLMETILNKLPTEPVLLASLLEKLKGKSIEKGLKKALDESKATTLDQGIAVSSLITHTFIEMKTNPEYKLLLPNLYNRLKDFTNVQ